MKTLLSLLISSLFFNVQIIAQKGPLFGSGNVLTRTFDITDFENISIQDFDGLIEIEVGKPYSIIVNIDDNLAPRLMVSLNKADRLLSISLRDNANGRLYLENTNIRIKVCLPYASSIKHRGNTDISIKGVDAQYFKFENDGNGSATLQGNVNMLDIKKIGNGEVKCSEVISKIAKVKSYGNGNVIVNASISLSATGFGNCSVIQTGPGSVDPLSGIIGNGKVRRI
jgi:Putative auto-transporter adhesin, head GIN domain